MINLDRSPVYTGHNIPVNPDNYYRGVVVNSYDGLWETDENGNQVMKGHGKGGTDRLSFQKSYPNNLYVNNLVKANTIIEGTEAMPIEESQEGSGYTFVTELNRGKVESGEMPLRVYQRRVLGLGTINAIHTWDKVFDSFPQEQGA